MKNQNKYGSRKLWLMIALALTATILLWFAKIDNLHWVDIVKWSFGIYCFGNVGEHYTDKSKGTS